MVSNVFELAAYFEMVFFEILSSAWKADLHRASHI